MIRVHGAARHRRTWTVAILAVKIVIIAGFVLRPARFAVSVGAAHGVAVAVGAVAVAAWVLIRRRHRAARTAPPLGKVGGHEPDHGHRRRIPAGTSMDGDGR